MRCNLDNNCSECAYNDNFQCPNIPQGELIKEYSYRSNEYRLCVGTHGKKYDLWKRDFYKKDWWLIKSNDVKAECKA